MAKTSRKVSKGVKIGLEVLTSIRQMKRGETMPLRDRCKNYPIETSAKPAKKTARRAA